MKGATDRPAGDKERIPRVLACLFAVVVAGVAAADGATPESSLSFERHIEPLLAEYCHDCHADGVDKGGLLLDPFASEADILAQPKVWETILFNVENWVMPPPEKKQPTAEERKIIARFLDQLLHPVDCDNPDPGRVTIRRLNRQEYNNTIRDLIGLDLRPADAFPADDSGYGFDNIGDVLSLPPVLVERYLAAADAVLSAAIVMPPPKPEKRSFGAGALEGGTLGGDDWRVLASSGEIAAKSEIRDRGMFTVRIEAFGDQAGDEPPRMAVLVDGKEVGRFDVTDARAKPGTFETQVALDPGVRRIAVAFLNDFYNPDTHADRNLHVRLIEIEGPVPDADAQGGPLPEAHRRIFVADPAADGDEVAARKIVGAFAARAFRRPVRDDEVDRLVRFVDLARARGDSFEMGVLQALRAVLVSPHFLFRIEWQPEPDNPARIHLVSEFALASRLSYFLWSSMPDDELLSLAFRGELRSRLTEQVERMLDDPRSAALAENFGGQWLETRNLLVHKPDPERFPEFDDALRDAMRRETEELFLHIQAENLSVLTFLDAEFSFLNERLARHYGIDGVYGPEFRKVSLAGTGRRGILTHAGVLTVTSDPARTSPVKRGKWVLENLLGTPPPPPPPNVPNLDDREGGEASGTLRERLEAHRNKSGCSSCHALMDPLGFGLENFGPVGEFRERDRFGPVDASGRLVTGEQFVGAGELTRIVAESKREAFVRCLADKMLTFALGRGVEHYDRCAIDRVMDRLQEDGFRFRTLVHGIIESVPFQYRRGDSP